VIEAFYANVAAGSASVRVAGIGTRVAIEVGLAQVPNVKGAAHFRFGHAPRRWYLTDEDHAARSIAAVVVAVAVEQRSWPRLGRAVRERRLISERVATRSSGEDGADLAGRARQPPAGDDGLGVSAVDGAGVGRRDVARVSGPVAERICGRGPPASRARGRARRQVPSCTMYRWASALGADPRVRRIRANISHEPSRSFRWYGAPRRPTMAHEVRAPDLHRARGRVR